jgi:hypothetical protein
MGLGSHGAYPWTAAPWREESSRRTPTKLVWKEEGGVWVELGLPPPRLQKGGRSLDSLVSLAEGRPDLDTHKRGRPRGCQGT